jgi:energy-coupling factor transporter transmembrane protein EcfT
MEFLRGPLYLDVAAKGLCFVGVLLMIFGRDGWFTAGVITVVLGVLLGALELFAVRKIRPRGWGGVIRAGRDGGATDGHHRGES